MGNAFLKGIKLICSIVKNLSPDISGLLYEEKNTSDSQTQVSLASYLLQVELLKKEDYNQVASSI